MPAVRNNIVSAPFALSAVRSTPFLALALLLAGCGGETRAPQRCRDLIQNSNWDNHGAGWNLPPFAKLADATPGQPRSVIVEGAADGAVAQFIPRPQELSGLGVIAVGYARVEPSHPIEPTDDDVTSRLWEGTVNLVNGYSKNGRDFESPYTRLSFTGREAASGCWKRFIAGTIPAGKARVLYPHFAFWGTRMRPGVKLHLAALSLVEAPANDGGAPESWVACPNLPVPSPALVSVTRRQWEQGLTPDGVFEEPFGISVESAPGDPASRELRLTARYRQGAAAADRFLLSVTEDGSDPRLSPTSHVVVILAQHAVEQFQSAVRVRPSARPLRVAVAAAAGTSTGLRVQTPLLPPAWQLPALPAPSRS